MPASVAFDARDFQRFSRVLRKASRDMGPRLRKAERAGAQVIADRAREIVADDSPKVAATIRPFTLGAVAGVQTGRADVPLAVLLEIGNASGNAGLLTPARAGSFRHPVFATGDRSTWNWTTQKTHPYLGPAVLEKESEAVELMLKGINEVLDDVSISMGSVS